MESIVQQRLTRLHVWVTFWCLLGLTLSFYAYYVEVKKLSNTNYMAMCDISEHMSCSKVFSSKYGMGFGVMEHIVGKNSILNQPNGIYGMIFYVLFPIFAYYNNNGHTMAQISLAIMSNLGSVYLAAILYILRDFCIVCVTTYVINVILLVLTLKKLSLMKKSSKKIQ